MHYDFNQAERAPESIIRRRSIEIFFFFRSRFFIVFKE